MDTQQGTPAWFNARKGKLTASNFGSAVGVNPWCTRKKALRTALGLEKFSGNMEACLWGTKNEKNAIKDYMIRTGNIVRSKGLFTHPDYAWIGGSPDGLVGEDGIIEVKCPFAQQVPHAKIPPHYYCQINGLMEIMDKKWCDFISWTPHAMKIYRVYRDSDLWAYLLERYTIFYACMQRGCPDIPNQSQADKDEVRERIEAADENTDYNFWDAVEPSNLKGQWDGPPEDPFLSASDSSDGGQAKLENYFSKRAAEDDGTGHVPKLPRPDESAPEHGAA